MELFINIAVPVIVIYVMFVVGLSLTRADFARLIKTPKLILSGTLGPFLVLPIFAKLKSGFK